MSENKDNHLIKVIQATAVVILTITVICFVWQFVMGRAGRDEGLRRPTRRSY